MKNRFKLVIAIFFISVVFGCKTEDSELPVVFSDDNLRAALCRQGIDSNNDGTVSAGEAETTTKITLIGENISDLGGLEAFTNLDSLIIKMLPIEKLILPELPLLRYFECSIGDLKYLDISANKMMEEVICEKNQVENLILPSGNFLKTINCGYNRLRNLDISANKALTTLRCNNNLLTTLDLSENTQLTRMISCGNQLTSLDVSKNTLITLLGVDNMPMLSVVYVWELPFPPQGMNVLMTYSPQIKFELPQQLP